MDLLRFYVMKTNETCGAVYKREIFEGFELEQVGDKKRFLNRNFKISVDEIQTYNDKGQKHGPQIILNGIVEKLSIYENGKIIASAVGPIDYISTNRGVKVLKPGIATWSMKDLVIDLRIIDGEYPCPYPYFVDYFHFKYKGFSIMKHNHETIRILNDFYEIGMDECYDGEIMNIWSGGKKICDF